MALRICRNPENFLAQRRMPGRNADRGKRFQLYEQVGCSLPEGVREKVLTCVMLQTGSPCETTGRGLYVVLDLSGYAVSHSAVGYPSATAVHVCWG